MKLTATKNFSVVLSAVFLLGSAVKAFSPPHPRTASFRTLRSQRGLIRTWRRTSGRGVPRTTPFDGGNRRNGEVEAALRRGMLGNTNGEWAVKSGEADGGWRVPRAAVEELGQGPSAAANDGLVEDFLPFEFELSRSGSAKKERAFWGAFLPPSDAKEDPALSVATLGGTTPILDSNAPPHVIVRNLCESDLLPAADMFVKEFGPYASDPPNGGLFGRLRAMYDNWAFSWVVLTGLYMRIVRAQEGLSGRKTHDHNVLCLVETSTADAGGNSGGEVVAVAELSLQPPDPMWNAPEYILPLREKRSISREGGFGEPRAYASTVLVRPDRRGYGYGRAAVAACEGLARFWGCDDVSLHVDADDTSGQAAQGLYRSMGYVGVRDTKKGATKDLYTVKGVPLLYLRKTLKNR